MPSFCLLIVLDGLGDRAHRELGGLTPLAAAATPNLDALAARGCSGLYHAGDLGEALPSENAHFSMFGYAPGEFCGRGYLEALGAGLSMRPGDVAFLAHLAAVRLEQGRFVLARSRPAATEDEAAALAGSLDLPTARQIRFRFHRTHGVDGVIVATGPVSRYVTDTDSMREGDVVLAPLPWAAWAKDAEAVATAAGLHDFLSRCHAALTAHPVNRDREERGELPLNALVCQRAGVCSPVEPFSQRWGLAAASIHTGLVYGGLAGWLGMDRFPDRDTDDPGRDLARRIRTAGSLKQSHDFVHVHTKTPDQAAHKKDPVHKREVIESLDRGIGRCADLLENPDTLVAVVSDHSTPSAGPLIHSGEPVPLVFAGEGVRVDRVSVYDETACACGGLGPVRGGELMKLVLNYLDRARLAGTMDAPDARHHWPGRSRAFVPKRFRDE
ncbi:MAG: alkaline phosphatase family protein [Desulfatibacillaceae bacterium]